MPAYGSTFYECTMTSGATLSAEVDLGTAWENVYLRVPTMTSNTQHYIQCSTRSSAAGGVYRRVCHPSLNSSTVTTNDFAIASSATNRIIPIPNGFRYMKVESTATVNDGAFYRIVVGT